MGRLFMPQDKKIYCCMLKGCYKMRNYSRCGFTCVLQPLDIGINKPFKDYIRHQYTMWASVSLRGREKVPSPSRELVLSWIKASWDRITPDMILNAFRACGYDFECVSH
ncbi:hypothetical protein Ae201684_014099 [Aphanomyces euteiches]|uniref:DDE-1 domain-containing protein n=1 Tax=Aphanomyces euteiches TaxID=100861 RepID=A0A6G0WL50_9STRA|nr:hypothetical protein Ae201684_014099 [Aphanomyces euteiches]